MYARQAHRLSMALWRRCAALIPKMAVTVHDDVLDAVTNPNRHVRGWAAMQTDLPLEAQEALVQDDELGVRVHLAENESALPEIQRTLAQDVQPVVLALVRNPSVAPEVLHTVFQAYKRDLSAGGSPVIWSIAESPNTPPEVLAALVHDDETYHQRNALTYRHLAANPNTPADTLWKLWEVADNHGDTGILQALMTNDGVPADLMTEVRYTLQQI